MPRPVVFIPGLPGSHLLDERGSRIFLRVPDSFRAPLLGRLRGPEDLAVGDGVTAGAPVSEIDVSGPVGLLLSFFLDLKRARSLYDILRPLYRPGEFSRSTVRFGWDWRRPVWDPITQEALASAIIGLHRSRGPVTVIAHSTGGLVLRHLLEDSTNPRREEVLDRIERVIAFGVPWAGALKTFEALTAQRGLQGLLAPSQARETLGRSWASFDLLPPEPRSQAPQYPALAVAVRGRTRRHVSPLVDRRWFPAGDRFRALREAMTLRADGTRANLGQPGPDLDLGGRPIAITNVVGWGFETALLATLQGTADRADVRFITDAGEAGLAPEDDGDSTIPRRSAAWLQGPNLSTFHLPIGRGRGGVNRHITLWSNPGGRNLLQHHVGGAPLAPFVYATVDRSDLGSGSDLVRVRFAANKPDGTLLDDATARFLDPRTDEHRFDPALGGRLLLAVPRADLRELPGNQLRLEVEIRWREGRRSRRERFGFVVGR